MKSNNNAVVPEAREALDKFKMEAAADLDVPFPSQMALSGWKIRLGSSLHFVFLINAPQPAEALS